MTRDLDPRIRRLEMRNGDHDQQRRQMEDAATAFTARITTVAAGYTDQDQGIDPALRAEWSPAMRLAWAIRFPATSADTILCERPS